MCRNLANNFILREHFFSFSDMPSVCRRVMRKKWEKFYMYWLLNSRVDLRLRNDHHTKNIVYLCIYNQYKVALIKVQHSYVCFFNPSSSSASWAVRSSRAAQLAEEVLSLKNDTYECWTLIKPTLYWLYMHKYTMFLIWWPFLNLNPTIIYTYLGYTSSVCK